MWTTVICLSDYKLHERLQLIGSVGAERVELKSKTSWTNVKDPELFKTLNKFGLKLVVVRLE